MESQWLPVSLVVWITALAGTLDARQQARFVQLCTGLLFARGRRTVTSWLRGCGMGRDYKRYYYLLGSVGRKTPAIARALLRILLKRLPGDGAGTPLVFAIDDSPTKRYGPHVEGAGKHHNPTPGPAGSKFLYGHVWVCLARLVRHPLWGAIALPIVSHLYIRAKDVGWMAAYYGWQFHTKLELAAAQIEWLVQQLGPNRPPIWVVTDGAYAKRPFLKRVLAAGVTVISRLRCDAALWSLPVVVDPGQKRGRGRPPKYGKNRIDLAKRAAQTRGWQTGLFFLYGRLVVKKYKTFLATYKPVGGVIRVVLVREPDRWVAYFSTDPDLSVASILETVADRSALEQVFHDVKEVHGAGQQQLRHVWANVGAWNLIGWWHTLVELWAWDRPQSRLRDRSDSPWDKPERRPSHANRCQELRREALQEEYSSLPSVAGLRQKSAGSFSASCAGSHEADSSGKVQQGVTAVENGQMLALDDAGLLAEQRDGQFALGVEFQDTLGSDRQLRLAEVEPAGDRQEPRGLLGFGEQGAQDHPVVGADGRGPIRAAGGVLVERAGAPDVRTGAMDLGVIDSRDMVAVPDSPRGSGNQPSQAPGDAVLVPGAVLGEGFQGFPGGGLLQSQDRLGDSVFLDVQRHGGNPLGEAVEAAAGEGPSEGLQQGLPDGPGEFSLGHDASPVSGQLGLSPPGKFRPGDATFQYGTPAQLLWSFSWKLLYKEAGRFDR